jgi:hypothetical protein
MCHETEYEKVTSEEEERSDFESFYITSEAITRLVRNPLGELSPGENMGTIATSAFEMAGQHMPTPGGVPFRGTVPSNDVCCDIIYRRKVPQSSCACQNLFVDFSSVSFINLFVFEPYTR